MIPHYYAEWEDVRRIGCNVSIQPNGCWPYWACVHLCRVSWSTVYFRTQMGVISSWYDFAVLIAVFPVCHWGNTSHKGRWIGIGIMLISMGSFICALPHFTVGPYQIGAPSKNESDYGQCLLGDSRANDQCDKTQKRTSLSWYFYVFLLGQTLHGFGSTPLFSIGTTYLDENVSQKASPVYLAIHAVITSIGPIVGLFIGGSLLGLYTDMDRVDWRKTGLSGPSDPRWIGAWWIGFIAAGNCALFWSLPMLMFAHELPEARKHRLKDVDQVHAISSIDPGDEILMGHFKHLPRAVWNILRNPTFVACIIGGIFEAIIINGFAAFMPKILETILSTTPTMGSYLSSVVIFAAALGVMLGGILVRKLDLQVGGMLKLVASCHILALCLLFCFLLQCPPRLFAGINVNYFNESPIIGEGSLISQCNINCQCSEFFNPVCHVESGVSYYSACHAGCTFGTGGKRKNWTDCSCVNLRIQPQTRHQLVRSGYCAESCGIIWPFLALVFINCVASFSSAIPTQQIMLRVVPFQQRTLGIGVNWTILRLLGFIPGGILFGLIIDTTCIKWKETCDGVKESCLVYDPGRLSWTIMGLAIICKLMTSGASIIGYITYRPSDQLNGTSVQTADSRGPLQLTVNDDRPNDNSYNFANHVTVDG